jgi:hypothetical protein
LDLAAIEAAQKFVTEAAKVRRCGKGVDGGK